jgi:hypothetical protein
MESLKTDVSHMHGRTGWMDGKEFLLNDTPAHAVFTTHGLPKKPVTITLATLFD